MEEANGDKGPHCTHEIRVGGYEDKSIVRRTKPQPFKIKNTRADVKQSVDGR